MFRMKGSEFYILIEDFHLPISRYIRERIFTHIVELDLAENLNDSLAFMRKIFDDPGKLIILIILNIIPIVNFIVLGYVARIVKDSPGVREVPKLENYGYLWIQGLKMIIVAFTYMIIPIIVVILSAIPLWWWLPTITPFATFGRGRAILFVLGIVLTFLFLILSVIGIINMIKNDQFKKAFAIREILTIIKEIGWGKYIMWLLIMFIMALVIGGIGNIPYVGWLISAIISPIYLIFLGRSAGLLYAERRSP
ncbi:MAG: DUF4013 domain-containing protein [Nitrososphaerota archaeon]|nr:DUF4013 domain-containing protein [Nitrososphaerota archaeon]